VKAINPAPAQDGTEVLHYVGYDGDGGGIVSIVRALHSERQFRSLLGVNRGFRQTRVPLLPTLELPPIEGERLGLRTFWRARGVAREVRGWLKVGECRVFHGHSRAGLAVGLWLARSGERRVVASVHCYGRQRWFYRWAERRLGGRLFWLSPSMKHHYGLGDGTWRQCIPGCIPTAFSATVTRGGVVPQVVRFGGIGALVRWKRWDLVLEALAAIPEAARSRIHFAHIGGADGSAASSRYSALLHKRTRELGLEANVTWRGEQASASGFLGEIDCLVISSEGEPFSVAMLEALAAGVPVLAADSGGATDIIVPPRNGWLYRSGDARDLGRRLAALAEGDALRSAGVLPGDIRRFLASSVAAQWSEVYAGLSGVK
jgi:glycosyltransferase involved in cell wall biosynthesis